MSSLFPGYRVVSIGGGTGLSTLLKGLKQRVSPDDKIDNPFFIGEPFISDLTAVVAVTDDGGSSGRLRRDFGMLPPGDLRNCIVALAEDEDLLSQLFQHRFGCKGELKGHSLGNLFITALAEITGSFVQSIQLAGQILSVQGKILPATATNSSIVAQMADGSLVRGERSISSSPKHISKLMIDPPDVRALTDVINAISNANIITLGPGSLYTSLITNLLVQDITDCIVASRACRVYIANLMTEANESLGMTVADHIEQIYEHTGSPIFDYAIVNSGLVPEQVRQRYARPGEEPTLADIDRIERMGIRCLTGNFLDKGEGIRHAADFLANILLSLPEGTTSRGRLGFQGRSIA